MDPCTKADIDQEVAGFQRKTSLARESGVPELGISLRPKTIGDNSQLIANIPGPEGTEFEGRSVEVHISIPETYPFDSLNVVTRPPIRHHNVDQKTGRCGGYSQGLGGSNLLSILTEIKKNLKRPNRNTILPTDPSLYGQLARMIGLRKCLEEGRRRRAAGDDSPVDTSSWQIVM